MLNTGVDAPADAPADAPVTATAPVAPAPFRLKAAELKALAQRSNGPATRQALVHLGAIALTAVLLWQALGTVWAVPLTVLLGYLQAFLFTPLHECAHQTAFRSRAGNTLLGHLSGLALLLPYQYYRAFHWDHHRYTQDTDRDPELSAPLPARGWPLLWYFSGLPTWRDRIRLRLVHGALGRVTAPLVAADKRPLIVREARCYLAFYALVALVSITTRSMAAVWLWIVPMMVGQVFLRPYLLAEHTGCGHSRDMLENTRTTFTHAFVRRFAWNMPYHAEHHAYPAVPFHALPRLHTRLAGRIVHTAPSYRAATAAVLRSLAESSAAARPSATRWDTTVEVAPPTAVRRAP